MLDLILFNGRIYPDASSTGSFEALGIWNGIVMDLGSSVDILKLKSGSTKTTNLHRHVVLPGFADSHIHLLNYGMLLRNLDLSISKSVSDIQQQVSKLASSRSRDEWILGRGWDDEKLREHRYPDRYDLDVVTSNPVFLKRICGHVAVANSTALSISGIDSTTPDPEGGLIARDSKGSPNGVLKEHAIGLIEKNVPQSQPEIQKALTLASRRLISLGLTTLHCIISDLSEYKALHQLKRDGKIAQSIYAIIPLGMLDELTSLGITTEIGRGSFRIGGVKLFLDGSLGARTAALASPYNDDPASSGMLTMSEGELKIVAQRAREVGFQLCMHAIGDKAVEMAIRTIEKNFTPEESARLRHRVEHASITTREVVRKMRRLSIVASVQPRFIYSDSWASNRLGTERLGQLYPFAAMLDGGVTLAAGSDCPVEDPNPFEGIWSAVTRPGLKDKEGITTRQALAAYTTGAAYASFAEDSTGTLNPGRFADLVIVDRDPFKSDSEKLRKTRVVRTMIRGKWVS